MFLSGGAVASRCTHFTDHCNFRRSFQLVASENPYSVERLQLWRVFRMLESRRQVEALHYWPVIRLRDADDLGVTLRGLWKQLFIRGDQIRQFHPVVKRILSRAQNMPFEIHAFAVVGRNREDMNFIAVLNLEF